ncbi:alpha/beta fold hydrolase [Neorhizobium galegae]|uniref:Hydrolase, alpha/beta hydrolase fold family protein n=1 Tax=Neorhizobium galegae bv. orientalis str. HAMBI 540 TaxID=1028800 RepID=A0A068SW20_NEOGA|nr:alpha/beta hydrolase [Neorhizobium galegae]CDN50497.1 Hydrolase, alpha/beta hydrolase fold family protein [Neorhizobium galegae bv. orientalis str. HAMBI 540]CDZ48708.1 Dihydrolipoyllysine-residue acetyltransferase component of acetoincleaving system [Neorhizobium galegae bv. orientalis]
MKATDKKIDTRHGRIRVSDTEGAGLPLLFLHGAGTCRKVFERQCRPHLLERTRIIALDLPGHGDSDDAEDPEIAYSLTGMIDTIDEVLVSLGVRQLAIFGWGLGGHLAIEMLGRSRLVEGLLLSGTPPVSRGLIGALRGFHPSVDLLFATKQHWSEREFKRFEQLCLGHSATPDIRNAIARADGQLRSIFSQSIIRGDGHDQRRTVLHAEVPVFLVNGADDPFIRRGYVAGFEDHARNRFVELIEGAGHAAFREKPEPFNGLLDRFIDKVLENRSDKTPRVAASRQAG